MSSCARTKLWLSSVASMRSNRAKVALCSALRASNQSPIAPLDIWTKSLRPTLAAMPIAAPASAAPASTPAPPLPHEKALSPLDERDALLLFRLLPLARLRVSVAIWPSLGEVGPRTAARRARFRRPAPPAALKPASDQ